MNYKEFIRNKLAFLPPSGIDQPIRITDLFPHQRDLASWAIRRGRAAIFADTGLGKSRMQIAWADAVNFYTKKDILILAPLAVAAQTIAEGQSINVEINHCHSDDDVRPGTVSYTHLRAHET